MSTFSITAARAIAGEPWLQRWRGEAAERWEASTLPSPEEEIWRYSRIAELDLGAYHLPSPVVQSVPGVVQPWEVAWLSAPGAALMAYASGAAASAS